MRKFLVFLLLCFISGPNYVNARSYRELAQKEISLALMYVHSASLFKESRLDAPWPTNIILAQDLKKFGWETLAQALEYFPSFYTVQTSNYQEISLRGVYPINTSNLLFLEDGFRLNSPGFEKFYPFWEYPLQNISKIELVRGAGTSLFGDVSLSGIVSIFREKPFPTGRAGFLVGNKHTKAGYIHLSNSQVQLLIHYFDRKGEDYTAQANEDLSLNPSAGSVNIDQNKDNYSFNFRWQKENFLFLYQLLHFEHSENRGIYGQILLPEDKFAVSPRKKVKQHLIGFSYNFDFIGFNWKLKSYFNRSDDENYSVVSTQRDFCFFPPVNYSTDQHTERYGVEIQGQKTFKQGIFLWGAKLEENHYVSYEVRYWMNPFEPPWSCIVPSASKKIRLHSNNEENYAIYGELKLQPKSWFHFNVGFRYDHFDAFEDKISPRLSLIFKPKSNLSLVFSYAKAFQSPPYIFRVMNNTDFTETNLRHFDLSNFSKCISQSECRNFLQQIDFQKILQERTKKIKLSLEESDQFNFSIRHKPTHELYLSLTAFYQRLEDLISRNDPYNYFQYYNSGEWSEIGLELETRYETTAISGFINYSVYDIIENKNWQFAYDNRIAGIPKWMLKGGISFKISEKPSLFISPMLKYFGSSLYKHKLTNKTFYSSSYAIFDINFLFEKEPWTVNLKIENLFDKEYFRSGTVGPFRQLGRTFWFKINFDFL